MKKGFIAPVLSLALFAGLASSAASAPNIKLNLKAYAHASGIHIKKYTNLPYALCAASGATPTNQFMTLNGYRFRIGVATCPVITTGTSFANTVLTGGKPRPAGPNTIWSIFGAPATFPQQQANGTWVIQAGKKRVFTLTRKPGGGSSNLWSFPCVIQPKQLTATNGTKFTVAICEGPLMENLNNKPIAYGTHAITEAAVGLPDPIVAQPSTLIPTP
jgi:hypothetical protein